jgi:hypothetical protein
MMHQYTSGSESVPSRSRFKRSGGVCSSPTYTGDWLFSKLHRLAILINSIKPWPMTDCETLAADVILWQGRAVAAKAERDLLLSGGMGGRSTNRPRPNQRSASSPPQRLKNAAWEINYNDKYREEDTGQLQSLTSTSKCNDSASASFDMLRHLDKDTVRRKGI